ncbi:hypothetical protein PORUE0001_1891, partial [Porphyromonas uenonis 60-3]
QLNDLRTLLKAQNMDNVRTQKYDYPESVSYMDLVGYYEQLGDYVLNVGPRPLPRDRRDVYSQTPLPSF